MRGAVIKTLGGGAALIGAVLAMLEFGASPMAAPVDSAEALLLPNSDESSDSRKPAERFPATRALRLPTGVPAGLSCLEARRIVGQARSQLAAKPSPLDPKLLAEATTDWLDPHGLWSAAPDAPVAKLLERRASELLAELEAEESASRCTVAEEAGAQLAAWISHLRPIFDEAEARASARRPQEAWELASGAVFEERAVARPAKELARDLGERAGAAARVFGAPLDDYAEASRERFLPELPQAAWATIVLAAAVRAYVPLMDPHGGWAPLDEETSLYEIDLESAPPRKLWGRMQRAALGARIEASPLEPLAENDLVLEIMSIPTAGLSVEQLEQLSLLDEEEGTSRKVVVLREGESEPRALEISPPADPHPASFEPELLPFEMVRYGDGEALVVTVSDVPDDLGELLSRTLARAQIPRAPRALLLDLRANGGGSTDGASDALSLFLPGATLFPMLRRDGTIEVERAKEPPESERWNGPVATLVDADTASAAEMIAGALSVYRRGVIVGSRTYGKGCAQEYLDDAALAGVLRLTTLVYSLPDGTPVQRVGLLPTLQLGLLDSGERESSLPNSLPPWRGPDLREPTKIGDVPWPPHQGRLGPCQDEVVCRALRALGSSRPSFARGTGARK